MTAKIQLVDEGDGKFHGTIDCDVGDLEEVLAALGRMYEVKA